MSNLFPKNCVSILLTQPCISQQNVKSQNVHSECICKTEWQCFSFNILMWQLKHDLHTYSYFLTHNAQLKPLNFVSKRTNFSFKLNITKCNSTCYQEFNTQKHCSALSGLCGCDMIRFDWQCHLIQMLVNSWLGHRLEENICWVIAQDGWVYFFPCVIKTMISAQPKPNDNFTKAVWFDCSNIFSEHNPGCNCV